VDGRTGKLYNSIILPKDTRIPTRASKLYGTVVDEQRELEVEVTEGEEQDLEYVRVIGKGSMAIPPYPRGAPVEVFFQYDNDGIIHVTVLDKSANKQLGELHIQRQSNRTATEIEQMKRHVASVELQ
jgi:molecular chaperone DnaK